MEALFGIALLAGLALVCVGLRRRAVGTTTLCARCEFNLDGLYPAVRTCPECGEMLSKHALIIGPRARRPRLALGGAALAITAGVPLIGGLAVPAERKPSFLLVLEARGFPSGEPDHAIDELIRRMGRKQLSASTNANLVEAALREQASREHRWNPNWGRLFEAANSAGATTPEQQLRYAQRAGVIDVQIQQRIHRGQIPYAVLRVATDGDGRGYRVGPRGILLEWSLVGVSIDGAAQSLLSHELADWPLERLASARWLACTGGQVPCDPANGYETLQPSQAPPIIDAPPGEHLVSFRWDLAAHLGDVGAPVVRWTLKPSVRMQVVSRADPVVELVTDDATGRTVQQAMEYADGVKITWSGGRPYVTMTIARSPVDLCFRVQCRANGREWRLHPALRWACGAPSERIWAGPSSEDPSTRPQTVDLILQPDPDAALHVPAMSAIWGREIVLKGVPVEDADCCR